MSDGLWLCGRSHSRGTALAGFAAALIPLALAHIGAAQPQTALPDVPEGADVQVLAQNADDQWKIRFEPSIWYVAPGGDLTMPGSSGSDELRLADLNLDSPRLTPAGELAFCTGRWRLAVSGFDFSTEDRASVADEDLQIGDLSVQQGDRLESDLSFVSWDITARYELVEFPNKANTNGTWPFIMSLEAVGGVRFYDIGIDVAGPGGRTSTDEFFGEPVLGLRTVLDVADKVTIDFQATFGAWTDGGDRESVTYDLAVGMMYRPVENVGIQIGYRQQAFGLSSGDGADAFEFNGALAGLSAGVVIQF